MDTKLSFLGAAQNVTGSRFFLEANDKRILIDCGLYQERKFQHRNWDPFPFEPSSIDAVLLTHAHLDHCGLIPKLVREGFKGKIYCTEATADITEIILLDSAYLQQEDAAYKKKRHEREGRKGPHPEVPLYTIADAEASFPYFEGIDYRETVQLGEGLTAVFNNAGHILGSSTIKISIENGGKKKTVMFSGDLGRDDRPILNDPHEYQEVDYPVIESTYGNRTHNEPKDISKDLEEIINSTWKAGGNIIVPSFALQRAQEILYYMNELVLADRIPDIPVFLDSPMAIRVTNVFRQHADLYDSDMAKLMREKKSPFDFPGLKMTESTEDSKALNHMGGTKMIIAGSGMCTGGRIKHHLVNNISNKKNTIVFVGYQAVGTLGRTIVGGNKRVRIHGQQHNVEARITEIKGFSAHADREEILKWMSGITPKRVFVVHGEEEAAKEFGRFLKERKGWEVTVPAYKDSVVLD